MRPRDGNHLGLTPSRRRLALPVDLLPGFPSRRPIMTAVGTRGGGPLTGAESGGVVALLFTDLVGSTATQSRLGDDASEELRRVHFSLLRQAIEKAGGVEVKSLGDGLMVSFLSCVSALACAVDMQRSISAHNRTHPHRRLGVRIGVDAGEPLRKEDDFFGTAVVTAKRLCDRAEGGQILCSEVVATLVGTRGSFRFLPAGRLRLKGLPHPLAASLVDWDPAEGQPGDADRHPRRPPAPRGPRLVGREAEMAALESARARASSGEFACVLLEGDPGVGKTRLAQELIARSPGSPLVARAYPLGETSAFGVWAEALERRFRELPPGEVDRLCGGFLDDLASLLRSVAAVRGSAPEAEPPRLRLLDGLTVALHNLAEGANGEGPLLVSLDDVHWADASSWEVLAHLSRQLSEAPLLVVMGARPGELAEHPVASKVLLSLDHDGQLTRLAVLPLRRQALGALAPILASGDSR